MASDSEATCVSDPNFAVICSFLVKFGASCGFTSPDFLELQEMLENTQELPQELIDLHLKLLRKIKKSVSADRWERVLIKLCHTYCSQDAWELERFGYKKARLSSKLRILKMLLEMQFDYYQKFKTEVNNLTPAELRSEPIGKDKHGNSYWFQIDECCQLRVYREDTDEETWSLVANDREGLVRLISQLASDDPSLIADLVLNEDSNSLEIEKPILDTGQTSSSTSNCEVDESSKDISSERTDPSPVETSDTTPEEKPEEKLETTPPKAEIKPSVITSHKTEPVPEVKKEEIKPEKPVGIDLSIPQPTKGVDLIKRKKSINDLAANLRLKSDIMYKNPVQEQEMDLSVKKPRMDPKQFSSLSEPPFEPISIESALRMSGDFDSDEDDEEFFEDEDEIELPSHMKPRLDRPTLLGNTKKKTYSDEDDDDDDEYGDEIEEPVMYVRGEGSGKDCNNENIFSEVIEEPVMYFYGEGSGRPCETGNEKEEKDSSQSDSKTGACVDSDSKNETKKIGTVMIDVKSSDRTQADLVSPKKASRWDIGKPGGNSVKDDKKLCDDSTNNSIKDAVISKDETDNSCSNISLLDVKTDVNKLSELQKDAKTDIETKDCSSPVQKALIDDEEFTEKEVKTSPLFFFGPGCLQFKQPAEPYSSKDSQNIDSKLDETENDKFLSESVRTNINKADILIDNKEQDTFLQNTSTSSENKGTKLEDNTETQTKFKNQNVGDLNSTTQSMEAAIEEAESTTQDTRTTTQDTKSAIQDVQSTNEDCEKHENIEKQTNKEELSIDNKEMTSTENVELITDNKTHNEESDLKEEIKIVETKLKETDINKDPSENISSDKLSTSEQLVDCETSSDVNNTENIKDQSKNSLSNQSSSTEKPVDFETNSEINNTEIENKDVEMSENVAETTSDIEISIDVDEFTSKSECIDDVKMETTKQNTTNIIKQDDKMESSEIENFEPNEKEVLETSNTEISIGVDSNSSAKNITDERSVESEISAQIDAETEIMQYSITNKDAIKDVTSPLTNETDIETKNDIAQEQSSSTEIQTTTESEVTDEKSETLSETLESLSTLIETKSDESDDQTKISSTTEENSNTELHTKNADDTSKENEMIVEKNEALLTTHNKRELLDNKSTEDERVEEEKNSTSSEKEISEQVNVDSTEEKENKESEKENITISKELNIKNDVTPVAKPAKNISEPINSSEAVAPVPETINAENESVVSDTVALEELNVKDEEKLVSEENISEPTNISKVTSSVPDTINAERKLVESVTVESEEQIVSETKISETTEKADHTATEISVVSTELEERQITIPKNKEIISENSCRENVEDKIESNETEIAESDETKFLETPNTEISMDMQTEIVESDKTKVLEKPNKEISMDMETEIMESDKTKVLETSKTEISMDIDSNLSTTQNKTDETSVESTISEPINTEIENVEDISDECNEIEAESTQTIPVFSAEKNIQKQDLKSKLLSSESENSKIQNDNLTQNIEKEQTISSSTVEENFKEQYFISESVKAISKTDEVQENISDESNKTASTAEENIKEEDIKPESVTTISETDPLQENISDESNQTEIENIEHNRTITSTNVEENLQKQDLKSEPVTALSEQLQENVSDDSKNTETESIENKSIISKTVNSQEQDTKPESITATEISESESITQSEKLEIDSDTKMSENISETATDMEESEQDMDTNIVENISKSVADVQEIIQDIDTKMSTDVSESVSDVQENVEDVDMTETKETVSETTEKMYLAVEQEEKISNPTKEIVEESNIKKSAQPLTNVEKQLKDNLLEEEESDVTTNENNSNSSSEVQESSTVSESRTSVNESDNTVDSTKSKSMSAIQIEEEDTNKTESKQQSKTIQNIVDTETKHESPVSPPVNVDSKVESEPGNSGVKEISNIQETEQKKEEIAEKVTETISKTEKSTEKNKKKNVIESSTEICETENEIATKAKVTNADVESCEKIINDDLKMNMDNESLISNKVIQQNVSEKEDISTEMAKEIHAEGKTELKQPEIVPIVEEKSDISITNNKTENVKGNSEIIIQPDAEKVQVIKTVAVEQIEENTAKFLENETVEKPKKTNEETTETEIKIKQKKGEEITNKKSHVPEKSPDLKKNCNVNEPIINKTEDPVNIVDQKDSDKIEVNHVNIKKDAKHSKTDPEIKKNIVDVSNVKNKITNKTINEKSVQNHDKQATENDISDKIISKTTKQIIIKPVEITKLIAKTSQDKTKNDNIVQEKESVKKQIIKPVEITKLIATPSQDKKKNIIIQEKESFKKQIIKPVEITKILAKTSQDKKKSDNVVQEKVSVKKIIIGAKENLKSDSVFDAIKDNSNTKSNSKMATNKMEKNIPEISNIDSSDEDMLDSGGFDQGNDFDDSEEEKIPEKEIKIKEPEKKPKVNQAEIKVKGTQNKIILKDINELIGDKNRYPEITLCRVSKKEEKVVEKKKQEVKPNPKVTKPLLTCVDITKLRGGPKPENKAIAELKQQSYISSPRSLGEPIPVDNDESSDVIDVPETDPLACTEEDILRSKQEEQSKPSGLSLATFKLDDTVITNTASLIPEPIARALRNRKICIQAATVTPKKRNSIEPVIITPKKRNSIEPVNITTRKRSAEIAADASIKQRRGRGRPRNIVATRSIEVVKSSSEDEVEEVQEIKVITPSRGTGKARRGRGRGRGRGGTPVAAERVTNDSPVLSSDPQSETSRTEITSPPPEPKPPKKKRRVLGLDIDPAAIIQPEKITESEEPCTRSSVRLSRRIAQQKIREEAERTKIEDLTHLEIHEKKKKKKNDDKVFKVEKKKKNKKVSTDTEESEDEVVEITKKHKKKRRHQDLKKLFNMANPWQSSSQSSTSNDEEEEEEVEEEPSEEEAPILKSDHEFSPESDLENNVEVQPLRRARTVKKESDTEEPADDQACQKCGKTDHPEWILLCDKCDCGWHCSCLRPALLVIPEGDWFCPPCQHISLVEALKAQLIEYDKKMNRREMEVRRKQRLAYVGISLDNVLPSKDTEAKQEGDQEREVGSDDSSDSGSDSDSESSSGDESEPIYQLRERRQAHSYRFNDYDELINSAIQDELEAVQGAGNQGRGKDIATIVNAEKEEAKTQALLEQQKLQEQTAPEFEPPPPVVPVYEKPAQEPEASEESSDDEHPRVVPKKHKGRKKHRKLNSLDINSSEDDPDDDEDFKGTSEEEEDDIEDLGSDDSELDLRRRGKGGPTRRSTRARIKRYDEDFINDDSDEPPRRKKNRSIWDESESEESDKSWGRRKKYKKQKHFSMPKSSKKRKKKRRSNQDSDPEVKRPKKPKIKYGGLNDSDEEEFQTRRTRGKKINYIDALGSDTDEERQKKVKPIESEDEYVGNEEEDEPEEAMDVVENEDKDSESDSVENKVVPKKIIKIIAPSLALKGRGKGGIPRPQHLKVTSPPPVIPEPEGEPEHDPEPESEPMEDDLEDMEEEEEDDDGEESEEPQVPVDIPVIAANPDDLNEEEVGMMMENEEYAKKQLELMAIQLAKEKKKKEKEAKKLAEKKELVVPPVVIPTAVISPPTGPKKRGRKKKSEIEAMKAAAAVAQESITTTVNPALINPAGKISPIPSGDIPATVSDLTNSPPKRRGRGKGKKTLAAEAATTGHSSQPETITATTVVPPSINIPTSAQNDPQSLSPNMHGGKLGIAAPPQPFAQNQPTPSVITRMLQSQPISAQNINQKYYTPGMTPEQPPRSSPSGQYSPIGRGRVPSPYRQSPPAMGGIYPGVRPLAPNSPHRLRSPGPPNMQMFHSSTHHSMDPSPSGGGPINIAPNNRDRSSPGNIGSPMTSKEGPTPPPPPYSRTVNRYSPNENSPGPSLAPPIRHHLFGQGAGHLQQPSPPPRPSPGNFSPYHPPPPPNYHYGAYPPPPALAAADDALPPTDYQGSPYPEHYNTADGTVHSSEGSNSKPFDEEGSGEFGGLVSYFSSQREDDLDT